nr:integrase, catalytic region, zinc finger, CCHC-type, peptidase aspartic, catalytic [Tanacetum cinerariifolium]
MANLSKDIQCAGFDTRPPMLDRTDFALWQQRIRLYCQGKKNGVNILKSIDEGPYKMGTVQEPLAEGTKGAPHLGRFVTTVKLNKGLRDSNYDQLYAYLKQHETHAKENKMMLERFSEHTVDHLALMSNVSNPQRHSPSSSTLSFTQVPQHLADNPHLDSIQDGKVVVQNVQGRQNRGQGINPRGGGTAGYRGVQNRVGNANPGQARHVKCYNCNGLREWGSFGRRAAIANDCDAFDSDVDEAPTAQTMFMANLSSADPVTDKAGPSYDSNILSEVRDHDHYQDDVCAHHDEHAMHDSVQLNHAVDSHADYTSDSNMIPYDQYVKDNEDTLEIAEITRKKMNDKMKDPECVTRKVKIAPHDYSKKNFLATFTPQKQRTPEQIFWSQDLIKLKSEALKEQTTVSRPIKALTVAENDKIKQHYKELYDSIKITRAKHIEQVTTLTTENVNLKAQILEKVNSVRVKCCTNASGSRPRSNTKKNRISPAKGVNKLPVEEQYMINKSLLRTSNRVDSSSRIKRIAAQNI